MRRNILVLLLFITSCNLSAPEIQTPLPVISTLVPTLPGTETPVATIISIPIPEREKYTFNAKGIYRYFHL
jgi:hypothetical protein